jgi:phosphotransferase system HPr (HPr) family protein
MVAEPAKRRVCLNNSEGLHLLAATALAQQARRFPCAIRISFGERHANAKSIWELIGLVAGPGCELVMEAAGDEKEGALRCLEGLFLSNFQENTSE